MGNTSSTRKISIPNDDPASVIKVSESVAQRLKGASDVSDQENPSPQIVRSAAVPVVQPQVQTVYPGEPIMTSSQVRQLIDAEVREVDKYWENRLSKLQETHRQVNRKFEEEYSKALKEVKDSFESGPVRRRDPPCANAKVELIKCLQENPKQSLLCSKAVQAFTACVEKERLEVLSRKG